MASQLSTLKRLVISATCQTHPRQCTDPVCGESRTSQSRLCLARLMGRPANLSGTVSFDVLSVHYCTPLLASPACLPPCFGYIDLHHSMQCSRECSIAERDAYTATECTRVCFHLHLYCLHCPSPQQKPTSVPCTDLCSGERRGHFNSEVTNSHWRRISEHNQQLDSHIHWLYTQSTL